MKYFLGYGLRSNIDPLHTATVYFDKSKPHRYSTHYEYKKSYSLCEIRYLMRLFKRYDNIYYIKIYHKI